MKKKFLSSLLFLFPLLGCAFAQNHVGSQNLNSNFLVADFESGYSGTPKIIWGAGSCSIVDNSYQSGINTSAKSLAVTNNAWVPVTIPCTLPTGKTWNDYQSVKMNFCLTGGTDLSSPNIEIGLCTGDWGMDNVGNLDPAWGDGVLGTWYSVEIPINKTQLATYLSSNSNPAYLIVKYNKAAGCNFLLDDVELVPTEQTAISQQINFENNINPAQSWYSTSVAIVDNPANTGINTSAKVLQITDDATNQYGGAISVNVLPTGDNWSNYKYLNFKMAVASANLTSKWLSVNAGVGPEYWGSGSSVRASNATEITSALTWYEISIPISNNISEANLSNSFIQVGYGAAGGIYYIDDISLLANLVAPGPPTIGTATAGDAQASVAFTAPVDNGGASIIDYTVTSSPGSYTATGTSSPIVVNGLTNGTSYTFTVTARNSAGSSSASSASNSVTPVSLSVNVAVDANLSDYAPTLATDITVNSGELTVDTDATVKSMTVNPGGKLTLTAGKILTVVGAFILRSDLTGTGTLLDNGGIITAASKSVEQYLTAGRNWYISSPVSSATTNVFSAASNTVYSYYEPNGTWTSITDNSTSLIAMKGYIARVPSTGVVTFSGSLNTGDQSISLSNNPNHAKNGFNLVGNPYPSYLNWDNVTKTNLMSTMWYRTKTAADAYVFDTYNASGSIGTSNGVKAVTNLIPPMQAFWVRVNSGSSVLLSVTNAQRAHADNSSNTFKAKSSTAGTQPTIRLEVSNGVNSDQALIYYNASAINSFDNYDSPKMSNETASVPEIYTLAGSEHVVINGLNDLTQMPLGFTTGKANNFKIRVSQFAGFTSGAQIILRDNQLNNEQDLTLADYSFYSDVTANNETRFTLLVKAPSVVTGINENTSGNVWISLNGNNQIVVNGTNCETTVTVYNEVGQRIMLQKLTSTTKSLGSFTTGVYIVAISNAGKSVTQKVIVK